MKNMTHQEKVNHVCNTLKDIDKQVKGLVDILYNNPNANITGAIRDSECYIQIDIYKLHETLFNHICKLDRYNDRLKGGAK